MSSLTLWFRPVRVNPRWESSRLHVLARTHLVGLAYPADEDVIELGQLRDLEEIHEQAGGVGIDPLRRATGAWARRPRRRAGKRQLLRIGGDIDAWHGEKVEIDVPGDGAAGAADVEIPAAQREIGGRGGGHRS